MADFPKKLSALMAAAALSSVLGAGNVAQAEMFPFDSLAGRAQDTLALQELERMAMARRAEAFCREIKIDLLDKLAEKGIHGFEAKADHAPLTGAYCRVSRRPGGKDTPEETVWSLPAKELPDFRGVDTNEKSLQSVRAGLERMILQFLSEQELRTLAKPDSSAPRP